MTRRARPSVPDQQWLGHKRMAPGGRLKSESPVRPFYRPVGDAGIVPTTAMAGPATDSGPTMSDSPKP